MSDSPKQTSNSKGPILWPLGLAGVGVLLLLGNFLFLGDFRILDLWPLLLVIVGAQVLLSGDLLPSDGFRTFGITRGSVESAILEINSGEIDVFIQPLAGDRLIAGQYAQQARPALQVDDVHAHLRMERHRTPWLSFADWDMSISSELPWQLIISSHLGQITATLDQVIIQNALISTGIGDIHLTLPAEAFESLYARSLLGNITVHTPPGYNTRITVQGSRFFHVHVDEARYEALETGVYRSRDYDEQLPLVDLVVSGTFGDAYLT